MVCHFLTRCFHFCFSLWYEAVVVNLKSKKTRGKTFVMISMLSSCKYSQTSANGHFFSSRQTRNPFIDSCLKPLYNGHLFKTATFFCPQGCLCREVQLYSRIHSSLRASSPIWGERSESRENARARGRGKESLQRSLINFHFHPGNPGTPQSVKTVTAKHAAD